MTWIQRTALAFLAIMWLVFAGLAALMLITSFRAIREVAVEVGAIDADLAWTIPLAYDALIIICSLAVNVLALWGRWHPFPLAVLTAATVLSTTTNLAHAEGDSLLAQAIAATPPVGAFLTVELGAFLTRRVVAYWHLSPAHDIRPAGHPAPARPHRNLLRALKPAALPAAAVLVLASAAVSGWLNVWAAAAPGAAVLAFALVERRRRTSPAADPAEDAVTADLESALDVPATPPSPLPRREVEPDESEAGPTLPQYPAGSSADPEDVWAQIAALVAQHGGRRPSQRELAAELRRSRTSISHAINAHRQEWDALAGADSGTDRRAPLQFDRQHVAG